MPGLVRGVARTAVVAGTATAVSNRVSRRQAGRWAEESAPPPPQYQTPPEQQVVYVQAAPPLEPQAVYAPGPPAPEPSPAAAEDDMSTRLVQLQQLGELKAQGILSDAEFETQKAKILGG